MFIEIPATKQSINQRKTICGVGINDADYVTQPQMNGERQICPYFKAWKNMIVRCYDKKSLKRCYTYIGCRVTEEWLTFSAFKKWMESQDWEGKELDKDILKPNNKIYSPETCVFISQSINKLLNYRSNSRGKFPVGVHFDKESGRYRAQCKIKNKTFNIGRFDSVKSASREYNKFKAQQIRGIADSQDQRVKKGLYIHADIIQKGLIV